MKIKAYAASAKGKSLAPFEYEPSPLRPTDIEIQISHCGICHSDIHLIDNALGISNYPLVPGHEIIGTISTVGSEVKNFQPGQRVGVGWQSGSCRHCEYCSRGEENLCSYMESTCVSSYGGYATAIRVNEHFAVPIPDSMDAENAAPLMCGGVTVYSPLRYYEVLPHMRVGIVGIGGLGHIAVQFVRAFGCEVTAFSTSANKEEEAYSLGAHHFVNTSDPTALQKIAGSLDFILSTVSADMNLDDYVKALKPKGKLCLVGLASDKFDIPALPTIFGQRIVGGSWIGSPITIKEMLDFSARHQIKVRTEKFPMSEVNQAIERVRKNKARYRVVLEN